MLLQLFVFLYGAAALTGAGLTVFWSRIAHERRILIAHDFWTDRAFVLAAAIALVSGGLTIVDGSRAAAYIEYGLNSWLKHWYALPLGIGLLVLIVGLLLMVWLADLEKHPPKWTMLRWTMGGVVIWAIAVSLIIK